MTRPNHKVSASLDCSLLASILGLAVLSAGTGACMGPADKGDPPASRARAGRKQVPDEKAEPKKEPETKAKEKAKADEPPAEKPGKFEKGAPIKKGLSNSEVYEWNRAQGDPVDGPFTLEMAFQGDPKLANRDAGRLRATFDTNMGEFDCTLYEDKAPLTVANFVGLARGTRPTYNKKKDRWEKKKYYDGIQFFRVVKDFMIQTGDAANTGRGSPGFTIVDEIDETLRHDRAGILSMANRGPNTGSSQFFITVKETAHLDGKHTVFGRCASGVANKISKVKVQPQFNHRPVEAVTVKTIEISRKKE
jgi:cyclophilin family peptidyl-prolyl cis-trans isomerase